MMHLTVKVLFVGAVAFVIVGFIAGLMYGSWKAAIAMQRKGHARSLTMPSRLDSTARKYRGGF